MKSKKNVILNVAKRSEESLTVHISAGSLRQAQGRLFARLRMTGVLCDIAERVIKDACAVVRCSKEAEISVVFVGDKKMRDLNRKYRKKDKTTNVLAFASEGSGVRGQGSEVGLGDIFISLPEAKREAKKYGWTLKYEIARLALHGFLHLLGYDHEQEKEARVMEGIERKILGNYSNYSNYSN